jgi:penicillin amidase/acyl-homoserine-lactone acylase
MSNRALRALELFGSDDSITFEEFITYKYDMTYSPESDVVKMVGMIVDASAPSEPDLLEGIELLKGWDFQANPDSNAAALAILTLYDLAQTSETFSGSKLIGGEFTSAEVLASFERTVKNLKDQFGRLDVPWLDVNRLIRGDVDLGMGGGPDLLHAIYGGLQEDGRLKGYSGDSFIMLVAWDPEGQVQSFSIHQYGSATLGDDSVHFADQSPLFVDRQLKPVWLDEADIRANLEREYRPGDELTD